MVLPVKHLSGGQKKLLGLARVIISRLNILLLDEPDNHLDLDGKAMLEKLIGQFQGSVVIVSHDRYFLDRIVDRIIELHGIGTDEYLGNYSNYELQHRKVK